MDKSFKDGFEKRASNWAHAAEIGGLGVLAAPSIAHLAGKNMSEGTKSKAEIAGLGILAAPSVAHFAKSMITKKAELDWLDKDTENHRKKMNEYFAKKHK